MQHFTASLPDAIEIEIFEDSIEFMGLLETQTDKYLRRFAQYYINHPTTTEQFQHLTISGGYNKKQRKQLAKLTKYIKIKRRRLWKHSQA